MDAKHSDPESELAFLGAMFGEPEARAEAASLLDNNDFTYAAYKRIFQGLKSMGPTGGLVELRKTVGNDIYDDVTEVGLAGGGSDVFDFYVTSIKAATIEREKAALIELLANSEGSFAEVIREAASSLPEQQQENRAAFPTDALGDKLATIAREFATAAMVPDSMACASMLATASASIGAGLTYETHMKMSTRANLYVITAAKSGTGKDNLQRIVTAPIAEHNAAIFKQWETEELGKFEGQLEDIEQSVKDARKMDAGDERARFLQELKQKQRAVEKKIESKPGIVVNNTTAEALAVNMAGQPGEAIFSESSEARSVISLVKGRYSKGDSSDVDFYAGGYSGTPVNVDRLNRPSLVLESPCISCNWLMQPDVLIDALGDQVMVESGFLPRFLFHDPNAEPEDIPEDKPPVDADAVASWGALMTSLLVFRNREESESITLSAEASEVLRTYDNQIRRRRRTGGDLANVDAFAARWAENACKIALVLHACYWGSRCTAKDISDETVGHAIEIVKWFAAEQLALIHAARRSKQGAMLSKLIGILSDRGGSETLRNLEKNRGITKETVKRLALAYPTKIRLPKSKSTNLGGRPSATVELVKS